MAKKGTLDHPKVKRLARTLKINRAHAFGIMCALWDFTAERCPQGNIGKYDDDELADEAYWEGDPEEFVAAIVKCRLFDEDDGHRLVVHDWPDHCEDSVHMKLARARQFFANGEAPKTARLGKEKEAADEFYANNTPPAQSPVEPERAHESKERAQPVRTKDEPVRTTKPCPAKPCPALAMPKPKGRKTGSSTQTTPKPKDPPRPEAPPPGNAHASGNAEPPPIAALLGGLAGKMTDPGPGPDDHELRVRAQLEEAKRRKAQEAARG